LKLYNVANFPERLTSSTTIWDKRNLLLCKSQKNCQHKKSSIELERQRNEARGGRIMARHLTFQTLYKRMLFEYGLLVDATESFAAAEPDCQRGGQTSETEICNDRV
jgi:hypothetical protein